MKKILYFTFLDLTEQGKEGLVKKVGNQAQALSQFAEVTIAYPHDGALYLKKDDKCIAKKDLGFVLDKFNYRDGLIKLLKKDSFYHQYDYIYIRNFMMIDFFTLKIYKLFSKNSEVILEIPTYPFDNEIKIFQREFLKQRQFLIYVVVQIFCWMHIIGRIRLKKYVKKIVTFNPVKEIWGIPTVVIQNAANVPDLTEKSFPYKRGLDKVTFIGVGSFVAWHGFDRFIKGIPEYVKHYNREIEFIVIGYGPNLPEYEKLVSDLGVVDKVTFKGILTGEALNREYLNADFAIGSLGLHRINLDKASPIKSKEYFAYGLPFIYAYTEDEFLENSRYSMRVPRDESPINIEQVIEFYDEIKNSEVDYRMTMNTLAKEKLTWKTQMAKIFSEVNVGQ